MPRVSRSPSPRSDRSSSRRDDNNNNNDNSSRGREDRPFAKKPINNKGEHQISIFVRNLGPHTKEVDLQKAFEAFGELKDVYMPRHYHSGEPRGFAYIQYANEDDAYEAIKKMDNQNLDGRTVTVTFAQGKRKTPQEMRYKTGGSSSSSHSRYGRRRSPSPYHRRRRYSPYHRRRRSYSRSHSPRDRYSRSPRSYTPSPPPHHRRGRDYGRRRYSRSPPRRSPRDNRRSPSPSPRDRSPPRRDRSPRRSPSPRSPAQNRRSPTPQRRSPSPSRSPRSPARSPKADNGSNDLQV